MEKSKKSEADIQAIFNKVIEAGLYPVPNCLLGFMCDSLWQATINHVISAEEADQAKTAIREYINGWITLSGFLWRLDVPNQLPDRIAIYQNWANRPKARDCRL